jgi:sterol desaturase/sphingolipid hydroxylase (fatty acid hydroxylase superfamily)
VNWSTFGLTVGVFAVLVCLELLAHKFLPSDEDTGYDLRDTASSLGLAMGNQVVNFFWQGTNVAIIAALYAISPLRVDASDWRMWVLLFVLDDLCYYAFHRSHHRVRVLWAVHSVHHSSERFNFTVAVRNSWAPMTSIPFFAAEPLLGFPPYMLLVVQAVGLVYQLVLHTEKVGKLWAPVEWVFCTPSHHRVHHASHYPYLDRNYGGVFIVWDRMFGSFEPEGGRIAYGMTTNVKSYNPLRVVTFEWLRLGRDLRGARSPREAGGYLFRGPGWQPRREEQPEGQP